MAVEGVVQFGRHEIVLLHDGLFEVKAEYLVHLDGAAALATAKKRWGQASVTVDVNCFALLGPDGPMLIDAGTGNAWGPNFGKARLALEQKGFRPNEIIRVLLTHIHGDHALGLLNDDSTAYFPNAEIWIPDADLGFFGEPAMRATIPEARRGGFDVAEKLLQAYGARIRAITSGPILDDLEAVSLPGHTPGHTGYRLTSNDASLMILGDTLHIAELQLADPKIGLVFDLDPRKSAQTRLAVLDQAARQGWIVAGGHISGFSRIVQETAGFRGFPL
jgi:glyoxylase-like metal-dependent hydrolase (beta-lactamase superfamily II)